MSKETTYYQRKKGAKLNTAKKNIMKITKKY